ncbi:MAG: hypothetical protein JNM69_33920 [Archangium sp.]|nr:hypothetical protein [Archangium sp.]
MAARRALVAWVVGSSAVAMAAPFDVTTAFSMLRERVALPVLVQREGAFSFTDRPDVKGLAVDAKNGFIAWSEPSPAQQFEFALFRSTKKQFVAVLFSLRGERNAPTPPVTQLQAWTVDASTSAITDAPKVVSSVPFLEAFVAASDVAAVGNLDDADVTPWLARVVKLPRQGLTLEVTWAAGALERECATPKPRAPELLCRNIAVLKYSLRRATWSRTAGTFTLEPLAKR